MKKRPALSASRPVALAERIERAPVLDRPVRALSDAVVRALPPGTRTDALHGVPFGQPAHPALVRMPLGCWTSAVLLDLFRGSERASGTLVAAGLAAALPSAATGLADWSALHRHQQRVGLVHAISQAGATTLFGASLLARATGRSGNGKVLSAGGLALATVGAYLGGHLALRLGAGASHAEPIDHLAGLGWHDLCPLSELPDGELTRRQLGYLSLLTLRSGDTVLRAVGPLRAPGRPAAPGPGGDRAGRDLRHLPVARLDVPGRRRRGDARPGDRTAARVRIAGHRVGLGAGPAPREG